MLAYLTLSTIIKKNCRFIRDTMTCLLSLVIILLMTRVPPVAVIKMAILRERVSHKESKVNKHFELDSSLSFHRTDFCLHLLQNKTARISILTSDESSDDEASSNMRRLSV